jgi:hypothetical protein
MAAGCGSSCCAPGSEGTKCSWDSKKVNQLSWLGVESGTAAACLIVSILFLLTSFYSFAQTPDTNRRTIHGLIVTAQGQPVARATVEIRDLRGVKMATGFTDTAGSFAIATTEKPGDYVLIAAKESQIGDKWVTLDQSDRAVTIQLPVSAVESAGTPQGRYTVSTQVLRVPAKTRMHLKLAHREFGKSNFAGAEREIDQALKADSISAAAFCMRALVRLASGNPSGAIEDATRALTLDPGEAEAYVALATAYNSLSEFRKAESAARLALGMRADSWQGRLELAKSLYGEGRFVLALRELDELNQDFPDVHLVRADVLQCLQRSPEAAEEFAQFLREAPDDPRSGQIRRIVSGAGAPASPASSRQ